MIRLSDEARDAWQKLAPGFYTFMEIVAAIVFLVVLPVGFVVGAIWQGLVAGFVTGRDI